MGWKVVIPWSSLCLLCFCGWPGWSPPWYQDQATTALSPDILIQEIDYKETDSLFTVKYNSDSTVVVDWKARKANPYISDYYFEDILDIVPNAPMEEWEAVDTVSFSPKEIASFVTEAGGSLPPSLKRARRTSMMELEDMAAKGKIKQSVLDLAQAAARVKAEKDENTHAHADAEEDKPHSSDEETDEGEGDFIPHSMKGIHGRRRRKHE